MAIIRLEVERKIVEINGRNNSKYSKDLKEYVSFGRTLLRLLRFMNFLDLLFTSIYTDHNIKLSDAANHAYDKALY